MLTEIHRQAADNPIIRMSMEIREGGYLEHGRYGESLVIGQDRGRPRGGDARRPGAGRPQQDPRRLQRPAARTEGHAAARTGGRRPPRLPAQQSAEEAAQRPDLDRQPRSRSAPTPAFDAARSRRAETGKTKSQAKVVTHPRSSPARRMPRAGRSAANSTNSPSATASPCTRRRAASGTTSTCSTKASSSAKTASAGSIPGSRAPAKRSRWSRSAPRPCRRWYEGTDTGACDPGFPASAGMTPRNGAGVQRLAMRLLPRRLPTHQLSSLRKQGPMAPPARAEGWVPACAGMTPSEW